MQIIFYTKNRPVNTRYEHRKKKKKRKQRQQNVDSFSRNISSVKGQC